MRKMSIILTLAVILLIVPSATTLAYNENEASVIVTYTKEAPPPSNPEPPPTATYEINIPASISLNAENELNITSNYLNLSDGQTVVVSIDEKSYSEDGYVYLTNAGPDKISVLPNRRNKVTGYAGIVYAGEAVAVFNNSGSAPVEYGTVLLSPFIDDISAAQPGTYTGILYFKIAIENG